MVARKPSAETQDASLPVRLFAWWHRLLDRLALRLRDGIMSMHLGASDSTRSAFDGAPAIAIGLTCLLGGAALGVVLAPPGPPSAAEGLAALSSILWAFARLAILRLALTGNPAAERSLGTAWSLGLIPWLLGLSPTLRLIAWVISGLVTWTIAVRRGVDRPAADRAIALAWGAQAIAVAIGYLLRNLAILLLGGL